MKTVDDPESPDFSPDGKPRRVRGAAGRRRRYLHPRPAVQAAHQRHQGRVRRLGADLVARRQVPGLHRPRQRQREAVPARSRHRQEDAADVRHARRCGGAVPRRRHAGVPVDRDRPGAADRSGSSAQRQHLQRLDAEHEVGRAASVHRRARRQRLAVVIREGRQRAATIALHQLLQGRLGLHTLDRREPIATAASADFGAPGPIIDFQAPLTHTLIKGNIKKKGTFEKLFLDGRPPVNVGVTSSGDVFGGSAVTFSDVLGDQQFNLYAASISQYRTLSLSYLNLARRFNYALQGYSQTQFFYGQRSSVVLRPGVRRHHQPRPARSPRAPCAAARVRHLSVQQLPARRGVRPASCNTASSSTIRRCSHTREHYQQEQFGTHAAHATARSCRSASPSCRRRRSSASSARSPATRCGWLRGRAENRQHALAADALTPTRATTMRLGGSGLLALRARGLQELGPVARLHLLRRQLRDARLRLPVVPRQRVGVPQRRAALPADRSDADAARRARRHPRRVLRQHGRRHFQGQPFKWFEQRYVRRIRRSSRYDTEPDQRHPDADLRADRNVNGFRLVDARASYGVGLETSRSASPSTSTGRGRR